VLRGRSAFADSYRRTSALLLAYFNDGTRIWNGDARGKGRILSLSLPPLTVLAHR